MIVYIWYPALAPANPTTQQQNIEKQGDGWFKAAPDAQGGPYPLILEALASGNYGVPQFEQLASHGFVVAQPQSLPDDDVVMTMIDRPLDILFILDQLTAANQTDFGGVIDTNHVGVFGFSLGAYTVLALTGARINPATAKDYTNGLWSAGDWDKLAAYRATLAPSLTGDALWPALTDPRIHAAVMFSACHIPMFGDQGLAAATVPSLIVAGTSDTDCPYTNNDVNAFTHLGSQDRYLVSIIRGGHGAGLGEDLVAVSSQLYTAFFDVNLKGKPDEAQYLTSDYVNSVEARLKLGLVWGPYSGS